MDAKHVVLNFWLAMQSNDFSQAGEWLSDDFYADWVLSNERIIGRDNFVAINEAYPTNGVWQFDLTRIIAEDAYVVTEVNVTDNTMKGTAITFHTVKNGQITAQREYWPDSYEGSEWRRQWVTPIDNPDG